MPLGFGLAFWEAKLKGWTSLCGIIKAILLEQGRSHSVEQLLDASSIFEGLFENRNHSLGHIQTAAATFLSEGQ